MDIQGYRLESQKTAVANLFSDISGRIEMLRAVHLAFVSQAGRARGGEHAAEEAMFGVGKQAMTSDQLLEWQTGRQGAC